jgi:hypothetical protein
MILDNDTHTHSTDGGTGCWPLQCSLGEDPKADEEAKADALKLPQTEAMRMIFENE